MATRTWVGRAADLPQIDTITIANTWAGDDSITVTINGKDWTLTVQSTSTSDIADILAKALKGGSLDPTSEGTVNFVATDEGEWFDLSTNGTIEASGSVVTITGPPGRPFTMTVTETTAGDGTATEATTQTPTGKHFFDNTDNWGGTVPIDADDIVFENSNVGMFYNINQSAVTPTSLTIKDTYTGHIGLPEINQDTFKPYREYRTTAYECGVAADLTDITVAIGEGDGTGAASGLIKLNFGTGEASIVCHKSGAQRFADEPPIQLQGTNTANTLQVLRGNVKVCNAHLATLSVEYLTQQGTDACVHTESDVDLTDATIKQTGGELTTASTMSGATVTQTGGVHDMTAGAIATLNLQGGTFNIRTGATITTTNIYRGALLDASHTSDAKTLTNSTAYEGAHVEDPLHTITQTNATSTPQGYNSITWNAGVGRNVKIT